MAYYVTLLTDDNERVFSTTEGKTKTFNHPDEAAAYCKGIAPSRVPIVMLPLEQCASCGCVPECGCPDLYHFCKVHEMYVSRETDDTYQCGCPTINVRYEPYPIVDCDCTHHRNLLTE